MCPADMAVLFGVLLVSGFIQVTTAQCLNGQSTNCGTFCCPPNTNSFNLNGGAVDSNGNLRDQCCRSQLGTVRSGCCSFLENQFTTCNGQMCPGFRGDEDSRDDNNRLRNQCCRYFRSGCCSSEENDSLEVLFRITIGVSVAVALLICLLFPIIFLCCFCTCPRRERYFDNKIDK